MMRQTISRRAQYASAIGELLQEAQIAAARSDGYPIVLIQLGVDELLQHLASELKTAREQMKIIDEKYDGALPFNHRRRLIHLSGPGGGDVHLGFPGSAGLYLFKEGNRLRLAVDQQFKLIAAQTADKGLVLIK